MNVLELKGISKQYGKHLAVDNVSFSVQRGEVVAFLGPNGAGKSTLLKIIAGCLAPSSGELRVCGFSMASQGLEAKRRLGYLSEDNALYTDMYVREYLRYCLRYYRPANAASKARIEQCLQLTGLQEYAGQKIQHLSKGYRQRVGIAQALLHQPDLLLLDEPLSGLDPNQIEETLAMIKAESAHGAVLFSSHSLEQLPQFCTRALIIHWGSIVLDQAINHLPNLPSLFKQLTRNEADS